MVAVHAQNLTVCTNPIAVGIEHLSNDEGFGL